MSNAGFDSDSEFPAVAGAYDIFVNRPKQRLLIEGLLLCDPDEITYRWIAEGNGFDASVVHAYAFLFFDVRPRLDKWMWVFEMLFNQSLYETISGRDSLAQAHRVAWLCGPELFLAYTNPKESWDDATKTRMVERLSDMYYKQAFVQSFSRGHYNERDLKTIEYVIADVKNEAMKGISGNEEHADAVLAFLQDVPLAVADPSVESNLSLPAREERIADHVDIAVTKLEASQMSMELMGQRRHADLIKAAESTIDKINDGAHPNDALMKSAQEHDLNSKEVALVSGTVNNALTVSHLADSEPEQKADPFVITNADEVSQQLFPDLDSDEKQTHNDIEPGKKPTDDDVESPNSLDPQDQQKKMASASTISGPRTWVEEDYLDHGSYMDAEPTTSDAELIKTAREAFGVDDQAMAGGRMKVAADLSNGVSVDVDWGTGDRTAEHAKRAMEEGHAADCGRMVSDPYIQLRNLKVACDEARTRYDSARTDAYSQLEKVAEEFRRTDAPSFARVSALAKRAGVSPATLEVVFNAGQLDRFGHNNAQVKLASAGVVTCTPREMVITGESLPTGDFLEARRTLPRRQGRGGAPHSRRRGRDPQDRHRRGGVCPGGW